MYYFVYHINKVTLYWEEKPTSLMNIITKQRSLINRYICTKICFLQLPLSPSPKFFFFFFLLLPFALDKLRTEESSEMLLRLYISVVKENCPDQFSGLTLNHKTLNHWVNIESFCP